MMNSSSFEEELRKNGVIMYTNVGTSMLPLIRQHRDLLIIRKPEGRLKRLDIPLYKRPSGKYVLHRILRVRKDDYVICGDNRYTLEKGITDADIIGVLTGMVRNGKEISVNSLPCRLYAHLWCDLFWLRAFILYAIAAAGALKRRVLKPLRGK